MKQITGSTDKEDSLRIFCGRGYEKMKTSLLTDDWLKVFSTDGLIHYSQLAKLTQDFAKNTVHWIKNRASYCVLFGIVRK